MPIPDRYRPIVSSLLGATEANKVRWQAGPDRWTFLLSLPEGSFRIRDTGGDPGEHFTFAMVNEDGWETDSFPVGLGDPDFEAVAGLWRAARRNAFDVDQTLDQIERRLKLLGEQ